MQRTPAGFPFGMPGMGLEMLGAMQHAPQPGLQASPLGVGAAPGLGVAGGLKGAGMSVLWADLLWADLSTARP
jgi:hypothetical protein